MIAVMVMAMVVGASAVAVRALRAKRAGGIARLSGGVASAKHSAKRANGAISVLKVCDKDYHRAYHRGHDPPAGNRHLGRRADAQVEQLKAAERSARCLGRACCREEMVTIAAKCKSYYARCCAPNGHSESHRCILQLRMSGRFHGNDEPLQPHTRNEAMKRPLLAWSALLLTALSAAALPSADAAQPNIIFIMADDLGYTDVACFGSKYYETPNIDRLATQGMKLLSHHHCQNCTPTRAALMSGQYGARTGVYTVGGIDRFDWSQRPLRPVDNVTDLPLDRDIFPKQLKAAGYATGMFGKWHIGERGEYHPGQRGFDEAIVSAGQHFDFATNPKTDYPKGQYLADFLTDKAVDFISRHQEKPFFLYLPHFGVHSPHQAKPELIEKFKSKPGVGGHNNPTYAAMIYSVDESVGRVMKTLDDLKLADNTVLIFTSDNGGVGGYVREGLKKSGDVTDNAPLRSGKGSLYEGGTREPFIVRWPGVARAGTSCNVPTIHVDIFPTMLELSGAARPRQVLDGESLVKLFRDPAAKLQRDAIFQHFPGYLGAGADSWRTTPVSLVQMGDWKLMEFLEDGRLELYNLSSDIGESKNLAKEMPEKAKELHARLVAWRNEVKAPMPTKNSPDTPPVAKPKAKNKNKNKKKAEAK
jgi:arylsulfatase A-like enzyme